jgi:hypothetical protein
MHDERDQVVLILTQTDECVSCVTFSFLLIHRQRNQHVDEQFLVTTNNKTKANVTTSRKISARIH